MSDTIEQRIRAILADEVRGLTFGVSADLVRTRLAQRRRRRAMRSIGFMAAAAAAIVVAVGTFAIYNYDNRPIVAATPSPGASKPSVIGTPSPSGSPSSAPTVAPTELLTSNGTMTVEVDLPVAASVDVPVVCSWTDNRDVASFRVVPNTVTLLGEQVTVTFAGQTLVIERPGQARYFDPTSTITLEVSGVTFSAPLDLRLDTSQGAAVPFKGTAAIDDLTGNVGVGCDWAPLGVPAPTLDPNARASRGSATLTLDSPASATVTTSIDCQWDSKTHVTYYSFPEYVALFGEEVAIQLLQTDPLGAPVFTIDRQNLAQYSGSGASFNGEGWGTGLGAINFKDLTPDPESYPINQPLPSPLEPFIKPIGGNAAAANLAGTLSWNCGSAPAGLPDVAPTPEPAPSGTPLVAPAAVLTVKGQSGSWDGTDWCGMDWYGPDGNPIGGIGECGGPNWLIPSNIAEVKAGSTLVVTVTGFKLASANMTAAPVARAEYYRGGQPDQTITVHPISSKTAGLSFAAPAVGDWVLLVPVRGTAADGSTVSATVFFRVRVTS